jgi:hypothetical protein
MSDSTDSFREATLRQAGIIKAQDIEILRLQGSLKDMCADIRDTVDKARAQIEL